MLGTLLFDLMVFFEKQWQSGYTGWNITLDNGTNQQFWTKWQNHLKSARLNFKHLTLWNELCLWPTTVLSSPDYSETIEKWGRMRKNKNLLEVRGWCKKKRNIGDPKRTWMKGDVRNFLDWQSLWQITRAEEVKLLDAIFHGYIFLFLSSWQIASGRMGRGMLSAKTDNEKYEF